MSRSRKGPTPPDERQAAKQERATRLEEAAHKRKRAAFVRSVVKNGLIAVIVVGLGVLFFMPRKGSYSAGSAGDAIDGVRRFQNPTGHTTSPVTYPQTPPAGGEHHPSWLNCGIYTEPVPNVYAVHSLEHGAVWVTYDPSISAESLAALREHMPSSYVVLSPFVGLTSPIVLSAWNVQLSVDGPDDPRVPRFFEEYWRSQNVPEPGALCTGGVDAP